MEGFFRSLFLSDRAGVGVLGGNRVDEGANDGVKDSIGLGVGVREGERVSDGLDGCVDEAVNVAARAIEGVR